jgi:hypothetical protein
MAGDRDLLMTGAGDRRVLLWNLMKFVPILLIDTGHSNRVKWCVCACACRVSIVIVSCAI